jgi:archaellin
VNSAIEEVRSSVRSTGNVIAYRGAIDTDGSATSTDDRLQAVVSVSMELRVAINGVPIDLTPPYRLNEENGSLESSGLANTLVVDYLGSEVILEDAAWTVDFVGADDDDFSLEQAERATLTVWLVEYDYDPTDGLYYGLGGGDGDPFIDEVRGLLGTYTSFSLEISPVRGSPFQVERRTPQSLNPVINLH